MAQGIEDWMSLAQNNVLQLKEAQLLETYEQNAQEEEKERFLETHCQSVVGAALSVLARSKKQLELKRAANLLLSLLSKRNNARLEGAISAIQSQNIQRKLFNPLLLLLAKDDKPLAIICSQILGILFSVEATYQIEPHDLVYEQCSYFCEWLGSQLIDQEILGYSDQLVALLSAIGNFLRYDYCRQECVRKNCFQNLISLLETERQQPITVVYRTIFNLWLLSFAHTEETKQLVSTAMENVFVFRRVLDILKEYTAEKVIRVTLSLIRNIAVGMLGQRLKRELIGAGVLEQVTLLGTKNWNDKDIVDDIHSIQSSLEEERQAMNSFELYREEVLSGALNWTPVHKDTLFWSENAQELDKNDFEVIRMLIRLIKETYSPLAAVACHDLAMYMKYHPSGRLHIQRFDIKDRLMELMVTGEPEVKKRSTPMYSNIITSSMAIINALTEIFSYASFPTRLSWVLTFCWLSTVSLVWLRNIFFLHQIITPKTFLSRNKVNRMRN